MKNLLLKTTLGISVFFLFLTCDLQAQSAMDCLSITEGESYGETTYILKNICSESIVVAWCLDGINNDTECGASDKDILYTKARDLDPNETYSSVSRLNSKYQIRYAACFGENSWSTRPRATNNRGDFLCE